MTHPADDDRRYLPLPTMSSAPLPSNRYPLAHSTGRLEIIPSGIDVEAESRLYDDLVFVRPSFLFIPNLINALGCLPHRAAAEKTVLPRRAAERVQQRHLAG
jgi:hypothetical protein